MKNKKSLVYVFKTKEHLALDFVLMLNPSGSTEKLQNVAKKLCRKYTREKLVLMWKRTASQRFACIEYERKKYR